MKITVKNDKQLSDAILLSEKYFNYVGDVINVTAVKVDSDGYTAVKTDEGYEIKYGTKADFFNAVGTIASQVEKAVFESKPFYKKMGVMVDCARNGVPNIEWLKQFIVTIAFSGYNYIGIYMEDCLEVEGEPLMGYMRGRFTKTEIKEIVAFADVFGIEVIPYIQTLAHLERLFNHWIPYIEEMKDVHNTIMIDAPRTYVFIENVIKACSECFKSKKIHVGMDEAPLMTRGNYQDKFGVVDRVEAFSRHVKKVCEICEKYGFTPMAWADMFEHYGKEGKLQLPDNLTLNSWSYYLKTKKGYSDKFALAEKISDNISFASGAWTWVGYAPLNDYSLITALPAVKALKGRTQDFCVTTWGDGGTECPRASVFGSLFEIANCANECKLSKSELNKKSILLTDYSVKELFETDLPNRVFKKKVDGVINVSYYVLFLDLFMGLRDKSENVAWREYFAKNKKVLLRLSKRKSKYAYIFKLLASLCAINEIKCGVFTKLREYYKQNDKESIRKISGEVIPKIIKRVAEFKKLEEQAWLIENKPFGIEVQNIRLGGLMSRLEYVKGTLDKYLNGELDSIVELEQDNLSEPLKDDEYNGAAGFTSWEMNVTYANLVHRPLA